jgi:hypothetical protein
MPMATRIATVSMVLLACSPSGLSSPATHCEAKAPLL